MKHLCFIGLLGIYLIPEVVVSADAKGQEYGDKLLAPSSNIDQRIQEASFSTLYANHDYQGIIDKYRYLLHTGEADYECMAWAGEAIFSLGEIKANSRDPQEAVNRLYLDDAGASDPIGYDLWQMSVNIGPNEWPQEFSEAYGDFLLHVVKTCRATWPNFAGCFARQIAILIAMGERQQAYQLILTQKEGILAIEQPLGEYLARFSIRFLAYGHSIETASLVRDINKKYGLEQETIDYWRKMILRYLEDADGHEKDYETKQVKAILKDATSANNTMQQTSDE